MLEADLKAAIEKNLSSEVGTLLKERLAKADRDASALEQDRFTIASLKSAIEDRDKEIAKHKSLAERETAIAKREADVLAREVRQEVVQAQLQAANARREDIFNLASMAFRNPKFVRTEYESANIPVVVPGGTGYGGMTQQQNETRSRTVTETTE